MDLGSKNYLPNYLSHVTSWHSHIPFAYDLIHKIKPRVIVELGVHYGDSYFSFCEAVNDHNLECKCFGIDTWTGEKHAGFYGNEVWSEVEKYNNDNYINFSSLIKNTFNAALDSFDNDSIDLLHIDGLHTYDAVKEDFHNWFPKVSQSGIILIHDINEKNNDFEVWKFWREIKQNYECFELNYEHGLGILLKNSHASIHSSIKEMLSNSCCELYYEIIGKNLLLNSCKIKLETELKDFELKYENILQKNRLEVINYREELEQISCSLTECENNLNFTLRDKIILQDKIRRITTSFSWKSTSPIRFLRRKIIDPLLKKESHFDPQVYFDLNPDVRDYYNNDLNMAIKHFQIHGKKEGRLYFYPDSNFTYQMWIECFDLITDEKLKILHSQNQGLTERPLISVIIPVYNVNSSIFLETIQSVKYQIYQNWELIIVDDFSTDKSLIELLTQIGESDERITVIFRNKNGHISEASNTGLKYVSGKFVVFLDHDDLLREHSLLRLAQKINEHPDCKLIYTDEDKIDLLGKRISPYFKPNWNPDLLLSQNYICHLCCIKTTVIHEVSGFRKGYEGCQDWDLFLRVTERLNYREIIHIPEILYHWRKVVGSTACGISSKNYVYENTLKTIRAALERRGVNGSVELICKPNNYIKINYPLPPKESQPLVSILIPTRDYLNFLEKCVSGILQNTSYENFEILILDNDSKNKNTLKYFDMLKEDDRIKIIRVPGKFNFSQIINTGVKYARGELLLFLNNDIEPINKDWLSEMVSHGIRKNIGCVGAKLFYQDDSIQHGGVILGLGGLAGHAYRKFPKHHAGMGSRLNLLQNFLAVTGACLLLKSEIFNKVNGFNEIDLKVAFNDVDLCLRVHEAGYRNIWTPFAQLYHYESASRGDDLSGQKLKRYNKEAEYIKKHWMKYLKSDPYYNPNLTVDREDFSLGRPRFQA